jgi:GT2 family glycosyltransferase
MNPEPRPHDPPALRPTLAVLLTCFNRKALTLAALERLPAAVAGAAHYSTYVVDDKSRDGTAEAIALRFPDVTVIPGTGRLYWNGGMRLAWASAIPANPDFYLWLNDDTHLEPGAIAKLLRAYAQHPQKTIVVGKCIDPRNGETAYGGYRIQAGWSRIRFRRLAPGEFECDSMNGNCVLLPACAVQDIGIHSEKYTHAFGDNDYGLRARRAGYLIVEAPDPVAEQELNSAYEAAIHRLTWKNWKFVLGDPKGVPIGEWLAFCREHAGPLWPVNFMWKYIRMIRLV